MKSVRTAPATALARSAMIDRDVEAVCALAPFDAATVPPLQRGTTPRAVRTQPPRADDATEHGVATPPTDFQRELDREMRRAERSGAPLSLVIWRLADGAASDPRSADRLLDLVHAGKRQTDEIGHLEGGGVAVLCPDTDERGAQGFIRKLAGRSGDLPLVTAAATYPDNLFESVTLGERPDPSFQPFVAQRASGAAKGSYALKRTVDLVGASLALCLFAPVMIAVAIAVGCSSPGPVIFRQARLGTGGVPFVFYKFRSMRCANDDTDHRAFVEKLIAGVPACSAVGRPAFKLQGDPRVTRIGRLIRKTSLDELPQLFNVLKGDMSLVGPRPPLAYEASRYRPWHLRRILDVKPGITGLWQVEGRSRVSFDDMVRMDLRYQRDCSLALDLRILLRTLVVVARCDGAV